MKAIRFKQNPIITAATPGFMHDEGGNINGPSLIRVPSWIKKPLGKYYLYFAHHAGNHIRMAYADALEGPWQVHPGGVLHLHETRMERHIASPDVIIDDKKQELLMYFHGVSPFHAELRARGENAQRTALAVSKDGVHFCAYTQELGPFYFRVFRYGGWCYALCKPNNGMRVYRSRTGMEPFEPGPLLNPRTRHTAVLVKGDTLNVAFTNIGDSPERIYLGTVDLAQDWTAWKLENVRELLRPETEYEGAHLPAEPSKSGAITGPVNQLRDPCFYTEDGRTYLLYSVAGENGIAVAELE